jgi:hypothetical protein
MNINIMIRNLPEHVTQLNTKEGVAIHTDQTVFLISSSTAHQDDDQQSLHDQQVGVSPLTFFSLSHTIQICFSFHNDGGLYLEYIYFQ